MSEEALPSILLIDDERAVLDALQLRLRREYDVTLAESGEAGLRLIEADPDRYAVVMSDMRMPGMNGAELLANAQKVSPDATRMLLTGQTDMDTAMDAVNQGQIFRLLVKPCDNEVLKKALSDGVAQHNLTTTQRTLLRDTFTAALAVLSNLLALGQPRAFSRAGRIARRAADLARWVGREGWQLEIAAQLSQIAAVTLPDDVVQRVDSDEALSDEDMEKYRRIPATTAGIIERIPRLEEVVAILRDVGDDRKFVRWESRVLGALLEIDALEQRDIRPLEAVRIARARMGPRDRDIMDEIEAMLQDHAVHHAVVKVHASAIKPDMVFVSDVVDADGRLVFAGGYRVSASLVDQVRDTLRRAGISGPLSVEIPRRAG
ncbi:MAG: response regulator [Thermoleophilia bacterium]